jgi:uncharacterized protein (DUF1697 family)
MTTRIAFLRAVNLGKRTVKMSALVEIVEDLGHANVWTHINSGNVVFGASGSREHLEEALEKGLEAAFGFEVTTFVRTAAELQGIVDAKPFDVATGDTHFVTFLKAVPAASTRKDLEELTNDFDTLVVDGRDVHWRMHGKSTDSHLKSKDWERLVGRNQSTSRNITMLRKLADKIAEISS